MTSKPTAAAAYAMHVANIEAQIATLQAKLAKHKTTPVKPGSDSFASWGKVGDLAHVSETLTEINEFFGSAL
jgi:hypothetical protein